MARRPGPKAFGTFVEYTNLVGALSFRKTVEALSHYKLVCIDEFELDDPGDTVLMSRLMRELADAGVKLAATSNTLPGSLGDGRFAAVDFQREIQVLADQFDVIRIDGEDFRHRGLPAAPPPLKNSELAAQMKAEFDGKTVAQDEFSTLINHLAGVHPSRYRQLIDGIDGVVWRNVETITEQAVALRFVVLADRLYDKDVPILASGVPFDQLFTDEMMPGGYTKKYYRAVSRLTALAREGQNHEPSLGVLAALTSGRLNAKGAGAASRRDRHPLDVSGQGPAGESLVTEPSPPTALFRRSRLGVPFVLVDEVGSAILDLIDVSGVLAAGLRVDEVAGFVDAVLDGLLVARIRP